MVNLLKSVNERDVATSAEAVSRGAVPSAKGNVERRAVPSVKGSVGGALCLSEIAPECDTRHGVGSRTCTYLRSVVRHYLQIIGNKANYEGLQRDTGTGLSVLLVP